MTLEYFWLFAVTGSVVLLGAALIYGSLKPRSLHPYEKPTQRNRIREMYEKDDHAA